MPQNIKSENVVNGAFIEKKYIKCPHMKKYCNWRLGPDHGDYSYLDNACYLSGSFKLECPD